MVFSARQMPPPAQELPGASSSVSSQDLWGKGRWRTHTIKGDQREQVSDVAITETNELHTLLGTF